METPAQETVDFPNPKRATARNPFFPMVLCSTSIFILTILAMVAGIFGDPRAPIAKFMDAHAGRLILAEVVVTLVVGLFALVVDRIQTRREVSSPSTNAAEISRES